LLRSLQLLSTAWKTVRVLGWRMIVNVLDAIECRAFDCPSWRFLPSIPERKCIVLDVAARLCRVLMKSACGDARPWGQNTICIHLELECSYWSNWSARSEHRMRYSISYRGRMDEVRHRSSVRKVWKWCAASTSNLGFAVSLSGDFPARDLFAGENTHVAYSLVSGAGGHTSCPTR